MMQSLSDQIMLTFDDVLLVPAYSKYQPQDLCLKTHLTHKIALNIPILSSAMDTVTESYMAIAIAQAGGMGIIHKNMSPEAQTQQILTVKRFEQAIIEQPAICQRSASMDEMLHIINHASFSTIPIVNDGILEGLVTARDIRFAHRHDTAEKIMTPINNLICAKLSDNKQDLYNMMRKYRKKKLPIIDGHGKLVGLVTLKDIDRTKVRPDALLDAKGSLKVGAAIGASINDRERIDLLVRAGTDALVIDTAHGHSSNVLHQLDYIKKHHPSMQVIVGNIVTGQAAKDLKNAGADAVKVGIGPGSICTTRIVSGVGFPQLSAIKEIYNEVKETLPIIADCGIRYSGDIVKAIAFGASSVMLGSVLAGSDETPGEIVLHQGKRYKNFRGMGSISAMKDGSSDRYFAKYRSGKTVPEGVEGIVSYKGSVSDIIQQMTGGIRSGMGYTGSKNLEDLRKNTRYIRISSASVRESHVHDVHITNEAPNYQQETL